MKLTGDFGLKNVIIVFLSYLRFCLMTEEKPRLRNLPAKGNISQARYIVKSIVTKMEYLHQFRQREFRHLHSPDCPFDKGRYRNSRLACQASKAAQRKTGR